MDSIPIVAFKFYAKYGHFRKPYSNVSSFSYPFPPRTALAGLLGAIMGIPKDKVAEKFAANKMKVAIEIENEIWTTTHVTNLRQDSSGQVNYSVKKPKTDWMPKIPKNIPDCNKPVNPYPMELLRRPSYLVYVSLVDSMDELVSRLKTERYVYTPCMGLSEFLAGLEYLSEGVAEPLEIAEMKISTVISKDDCSLSIDALMPEDGYNIQELTVPYIGTPDRTFIYKRYLVDLTSKPIPVQMKTPSFQFEDKFITFL